MPNAPHGHQLQYQEVECAPSFRLIIHTQHAPHELPAEIAANTCVLNYLHARTCLNDEFLDLFMRQEKSRLFKDRVNVIQVERAFSDSSISSPLLSSPSLYLNLYSVIYNLHSQEVISCMNRIERVENSLIDHCIADVGAASSSSTQPADAAASQAADTSYSGDVKHIVNDMPLSRLITELAHEWDDAVEALTREKVTLCKLEMNERCH